MKPVFTKDAKDFGRVAVLIGGTAAEREISLNISLSYLVQLNQYQRLTLK
jgi:D-alanine-D-alanine ligase